MLIASLLLIATQAQEPRVVPNRIDCPRCTIQLTQVAVLGTPDEGLVDWPMSISEDRAGRYYVAQPNKREMPTIFGADGRKQAVLGREGSGPGEFRVAAFLAVDSSDTLFVADWSNSRLTVISPQRKFVRSFPFPWNTMGLVVLRDNTLAIKANVNDRETVGLPFHIFQRDGQRVRAIGDRSRPFTQARQIFFLYRMAPSRRGGFWAVPENGNYLIEHWTANGTRDVYLKRTPEWHTALEYADAGRDFRTMDKPPSQMMGIAEADDGLLWVVTRVADPRRGRAKLDTLRNEEGQYTVPKDTDRVWDSVIELIDPRRGTVLAERRFDELFSMVLPSGKVVHIKEGDTGLTARVLKLGLKRER